MKFDDPLNVNERKTLRKWQLFILESLKNFHEFSLKHNLAYWLDAGSILGAVRHQGFIPWDDDLDICMLEDDFKRLKRMLITDHNLGSTYHLVFNDSTDPNYIGLRSNRSCPRYIIDLYCTQRFRKPKIAFFLKQQHHNLYKIASVLGLSGTFPDSTHQEKRVFMTFEGLKESLKAIGMTKLSRRHLYVGVLCVPFFRIPIPVVAYLFRLALKVLESSSGDLIDYHRKSRFSFNKPLKSKGLFPLSSISFENQTFSSPQAPNEYLKSVFGDDYMVPVEFDMRRPQHFEFSEMEDLQKIGIERT